MIRQTQGDGMNKTERAFFERLKLLYTTGRIYVQSFKLKLANGCFYTPDFVLVQEIAMPGSPLMCLFTAWETKGFMRDDAAVKIKVAAREYGFINFYLVNRQKGQWNQQKVMP